MRTKIREIRYTCGAFLDVSCFPVYKNAKGRKRKFCASSECQKNLNEKNSRRRLSRLMHANFCERDLALHLTYREEEMPKTEEEAKGDVKNFLRRLRRLYKGSGIELKYISVTEKGERSSRVHHHLVVTGGVSRDEVERLWKKGRANTKRLQFDETGIAGIASYMTKQKLYFRRYNASRNLIDPDKWKKVSDNRMSRGSMGKLMFYSDKETVKRLYPGYRLVDVSYSRCELSGEYYAYIRLKRERLKTAGNRRV